MQTFLMAYHWKGVYPYLSPLAMSKTCGGFVAVIGNPMLHVAAFANTVDPFVAIP